MQNIRPHGVSVRDLPRFMCRPAYPQVIPQNALRLWDSFTAHFPLCITELWGYELHLNDPVLKTDFQVCIDKSSRREFLDELLYGSLKQFQWGGLTRMVQDWNNVSHPLSAEVENIWMEFDSGAISLGQYEPNLFFGPVSQKELLPLCRKVFGYFKDVHLQEEAWDRFEHLIRSLPGRSWIPQAGMMLAREKNRLRLYLHELDAKDIPALLETFVPGLSDVTVKKFLFSGAVSARFIDLDLDIGKEAGSVAGLEYYFNRNNRSGPLEFLHFLLGEGCVSPEGVQAMERYLELSHGIVPEPFTEFLHHIKVILRSSGVNEAKAYLGVQKNHLLNYTIQ